VQEEWRRRTEAEYRSCAIAQHLTLWLIQIGASPDLIQAGLSISADELGHAAMSHEVFVLAGGTGMPRIDRDQLALFRTAGDPLEYDVLRTCVDVFCLGETVAVPLFKELRQAARVPDARRTLDQVLRDEVRHRDFGWTLLAWLLGTPLGPPLRALVQAELPRMFMQLHSNYARPGSADETAIADGDLLWGLMPAARYGQVLLRTVERDFVPRFARLGIDARQALQAGHVASPAGSR
jgi:hypothetical protein